MSNTCQIPIQITPVIENPPENQQIEKIGKISKLHEFVQRQMCELFQPQGRIHAGQPLIKRDQLRVLPAGRHEMHELSQFFKTKQEKQVRIPMPPETPELLRECRTDTPVCPSACL